MSVRALHKSKYILIESSKRSLRELINLSTALKETNLKINNFK